MSASELRAFWEAIQSDEILQQKVSSTNDLKDILAIAREAGFSISSEAFEAALSEVSQNSERLVIASAGGSCCCGFSSFCQQ